MQTSDENTWACVALNNVKYTLTMHVMTKG